MVQATPHLNALGWRTSKTFDASKGAYDGVMEQKRVFLYDASWRIIEEHTDIDFDTSPGTDWKSQHFWGLRYIDDLVAKRVDRDADGDWADASCSVWYMVTDSQFSVSAVLDADRSVWERIEYDAYGNARHRYAGDANGDGRYGGFFEFALAGGDAVISSSNYHVDFDVDFDGIVNLSTTPTDFNILSGRGTAITTALPDGWIGDPSSSTGPDNSIGYAGYVFNPEREDYSVRFRVYAPELGRWRTRDPIGYVDGSGVSNYVGNNPNRFIDPFGLSPEFGYRPQFGYEDSPPPPPPGFTVGSRPTNVQDPKDRFWADTLGGHVDIFYDGILIRVGFGGARLVGETKAERDTIFTKLRKKNKGNLWQDPSIEGPPVPCALASDEQIKACVESYPKPDGKHGNFNNCQTDVQSALEDCCLTGYSSLSTKLSNRESRN